MDWFYQNAEISDDLGVRWLTDVPLPQYKNPGPWQSAFAQGRGISIVLRGFQLTDDNPPEADQPRAEAFGRKS